MKFKEKYQLTLTAEQLANVRLLANSASFKGPADIDAYCASPEMIGALRQVLDDHNITAEWPVQYARHLERTATRWHPRRLVTYTFYDGYGAECETATVPADEASGRAAAFMLAQASEGLAGRVEFLNPEDI